MLSHVVFFTLKDKSADSVAQQIAACEKYLKPHDGVVFFAAGSRTPDLSRPVNDSEFDVALHVIFEDRASHDAYQVHELHLQFIDENKERWEQVRVFDSDC